MAGAAAARDCGGIREGPWLVGYLLLLLGASTLGSFGGHEVLDAPWDSLAVAALGALTYVAAVASGRRHVGTADPTAH